MFIREGHKILNKYIFKGSDKAHIDVTDTNAQQHPADEHPSSEKVDTPSHLGSSTSSSSSRSISIIQSADLPMVSSSSSSSTSMPASLIHNTKDNTKTTNNTKSVLIDEMKQYCDCR